jgi:hypothetical protein
VEFDEEDFWDWSTKRKKNMISFLFMKKENSQETKSSLHLLHHQQILVHRRHHLREEVFVKGHHT